MKLKSILSVLFVFSIIVAVALVAPNFSGNTRVNAIPNDSNLVFQKVSLNKIESKTRDATIKIYNDLGGHGSGTYFLYRNYHVVFTAAHVVRGSRSVTAVDKEGNKRMGMIVYIDNKIDFAIILIPKFEKVTPIKFSVPNYKPSEQIGKKVIFSGYPGRQSLRTVRGSVAGIEGRYVIVHSTAWKGSSGSCVFDSRGDFVGILFAITVTSNERSKVLLESMIWVEPHDQIDWDKVSEIIDSLN